MKTPWIIGWLCVAASACALEVKEARWGFDGRVVPERFNLLSVRVANPDNEPFNGIVRLQPINAFEPVGAALAQPCYVVPFGERWIQFHPYISGNMHWRIFWGRRSSQQFSLDPPAHSSPAVVVLAADNSMRARSSVWPVFPESLFPTTVAATDGLSALLLDHAPRWEAARREAFLDWLRRGGTVHVLPGAGKFPSELGVLNGTEERSTMGNGCVMRHQLTLSQLTPAELARRGFVAPRLETTESASIHEMPTATVLRALSGFTRPKISWGLIQALAFGYVFVLSLGQYVVIRKTRDYRCSLGLVIGSVAAFGALFAFVGSRGWSESNAVHSLAYARSIGGGQYVVTQWANLFVTRGAQYTIAHGNPHDLYATANDFEAVDGQIESGRNGRFVVDLPLYAHRSFLHQTRLADDSTNLTANALGFWQLYDGKVYDSLALAVTTEPLGEFLSVSKLREAQRAAEYNSDNPERAIRAMAPLLIAWSLGGTPDFAEQIVSPAAPAGRTQLFVLRRAPPSFQLKSPPLRHQTGWVLYHLDAP
jgi:hypothetical protein